jgi:uncharacterized protein DUF1552
LPHTSKAASGIDKDKVPLRIQLAQQMLVAGMACDVARVGTIMMAPSRSDMYLTWLGGALSEWHHNLSHESNENTAAQSMLVSINQWYASQVSALITQLKAVPENGGTMFDGTVILWANEIEQGCPAQLYERAFPLGGQRRRLLQNGPGGDDAGVKWSLVCRSRHTPQFASAFALSRDGAPPSDDVWQPEVLCRRTPRANRGLSRQGGLAPDGYISVAASQRMSSM